MNRTQHRSNNSVLGAPAGWDQQEIPCSALPITRVDFDGQPGIMSFWRPTPDELAALNAGALVALSVIGSTMPPVALSVEEA